MSKRDDERRYADAETLGALRIARAFRNDGDQAVRDLAKLREAAAKLAEAAGFVVEWNRIGRDALWTIEQQDQLEAALAAVRELVK